MATSLRAVVIGFAISSTQMQVHALDDLDTRLAAVPLP